MGCLYQQKENLVMFTKSNIKHLSYAKGCQYATACGAGLYSNTQRIVVDIRKEVTCKNCKKTKRFKN